MLAFLCLRVRERHRARERETERNGRQLGLLLQFSAEAAVKQHGISQTEGWTGSVGTRGPGFNVNDKSAVLASPLVMMLVSPFLLMEMMVEKSVHFQDLFF